MRNKDDFTPESLTPPVPCEFKVGDKVTFTNDYGAVFKSMTVVGFTDEVTSWGASVYLDSDAYWHPFKPETLELEA